MEYFISIALLLRHFAMNLFYLVSFFAWSVERTQFNEFFQNNLPFYRWKINSKSSLDQVICLIETRLMIYNEDLIILICSFIHLVLSVRILI